MEGTAYLGCAEPVVKEYCTPRSYLVNSVDGVIYRRNRRHLMRVSKRPPVPDEPILEDTPTDRELRRSTWRTGNYITSGETKAQWRWYQSEQFLENNQTKSKVQRLINILVNIPFEKYCRTLLYLFWLLHLSEKGRCIIRHFLLRYKHFYVSSWGSWTSDKHDIHPSSNVDQRIPQDI